MVRVNLRVRAGLDDLKPDAKIAEMSRSGETTGDCDVTPFPHVGLGVVPPTWSHARGECHLMLQLPQHVLATRGHLGQHAAHGHPGRERAPFDERRDATWVRVKARVGVRVYDRCRETLAQK